MDTKRLLTGTVVGGIVIAAVGFLLFEIVFAGFFDANMIVSGREAPIIWAAALSALAHGLLLTLVLDWAGASTIGSGLKIGALLGLLIWLGADMILYGVFEYATAVGAVADSVISSVHYGAAGAAVAAVTGGRTPEGVAAAPAQV